MKSPSFDNGDFTGLILSVKTEEEAKTVVLAYDRWLKTNAPKLSSKARRSLIQHNIGWCFGEGMAQAEKAMWHKVCGAEHPIFGLSQPTPQEAYEAGKKLGEALKNKQRRSR